MRFNCCRVICNPSYCAVLMNSWLCSILIFSCWGMMTLLMLSPTISYAIRPSVPKVVTPSSAASSLAESSLRGHWLLWNRSVALSSAVLLSSFTLTTVVYAYIIGTTLRTTCVPSHNKAFFPWIRFTRLSSISSLAIAYASCRFDDAGPEEKLLCCKLSANLQVPLRKSFQKN